MNEAKFYYKEWHLAEKDGNTKYALVCKKMYRKLVMKVIIKEYHYYSDMLKQFPLININ